MSEEKPHNLVEYPKVTIESEFAAYQLEQQVKSLFEGPKIPRRSQPSAAIIDKFPDRPRHVSSQAPLVKRVTSKGVLDN